MEALLLTCLQANLFLKKVYVHEALSDSQKKEITAEIKNVTRKECFVDAKAD